MSNGKLIILSQSESALLRNAYLKAFIDASSEYYRDYIETKKQFEDGARYTGYLWDVLRSRERITSQRFAQEVTQRLRVYAMADDHSRQRVMSAPLWAYPPYSVISLASGLLLQLLPALPEDVYVFDEAMSWTVVRTHEYDAKRRICWAVGIEA